MPEDAHERLTVVCARGGQVDSDHGDAVEALAQQPTVSRRGVVAGALGVGLQAIDKFGRSVADLNLSVAFYERLGFTQVGDSERGATLSAGNANLFLFQSTRPQAQAARELSMFENPPGLDHLSLQGRRGRPRMR